LDYGKGYQYAHDSKDKLTTMTTIPPEIKNERFYQPTASGREVRFQARLAQIKQWHAQHPDK
ncbi:MAG: replication-associated recombination protein A, partial [Limosilactobacillus oris]